MSESYAALMRARSLVAIRKYDETLTALAPALVDSATEAEGQRLRGQSLLGLGRVTEAEAAVRRSLQLEPDSEWAHRLLALCLQRRGKHRAALQEAREAVRISPGLPAATNTLVVCLINDASRQEAAKVASQALEQNPHSALAHETAGLAASAQKRWADAEQHYRAALSLAPEDTDVQRQLAEALKHLGRRDEAGELLLAAARTDPTNKQNRSSLARLGVPGLVGGGFVLKTFLLKIVFINLLLHLLRPTPAVLFVAVVIVIRVGWGLVRRVLGTRSLPPEVRRGLWSEHWDFVLLWWFYSALIAIPLAVLCWLGRPANDPLALALAGFCALSLAGLYVTGHIPHVRWRLPRWLRRSS